MNFSEKLEDTEKLIWVWAHILQC